MMSRLAEVHRSISFERPRAIAARPVPSRSFWLVRYFLVSLYATAGTSWLTGCGGDKETDKSQEAGCYIAVSVEGSVDYEQTHRDLFCLYLTSFESGISTVFIPYDEPFDGITLDIDEIGIDEVGTFPASLTFSHEDGRTFRSDDCEVSVESHEPDGEDVASGVSYRVRGSGSCTSPAVSVDDPDDNLAISEFEFASGVIWGQ